MKSQPDILIKFILIKNVYYHLKFQVLAILSVTYAKACVPLFYIYIYIYIYIGHAQYRRLFIMFIV